MHKGCRVGKLILKSVLLYCTPHKSVYDRLKHVLGIVQIMNRIIMQITPITCYIALFSITWSHTYSTCVICLKQENNFRIRTKPQLKLGVLVSGFMF